MKPELLARLLQELKTFPLREQYESEEPDLLGHVVERIGSVLPADYQIITGSWDKNDCARAFGGSFWPDILIRCKGEDVLVLELKLLKKKSRGPTNAIKATVGQCLVYRAKYPVVIGLLVNQGADWDHSHVYDESVLSLLENQGITFIVRK